MLYDVEATADRRLRTMEPPGSAGETAKPGNGEEGLDPIDIHQSVFPMPFARIMHWTRPEAILRFKVRFPLEEERGTCAHKARRLRRSARCMSGREGSSSPIRGRPVRPGCWPRRDSRHLPRPAWGSPICSAADSHVTRDEVIANCRVIAEATDLPVNADLENCFAHEPDAAADTIRIAAEAGAVGGSIEDFSGDRNDPIYDFDLAVARVRAAVQVAHSLPVPFLLTARAENLIHGRTDMADTIRRLQAYEAAGADVLYAPGPRNLSEVRQVVAAVKRPVNVVTGWLDPGITLAQLAEAGAKRISVGGALSRLVLATFVKAAHDMQEHGSFAWMHDMMGSTELGTMFAAPRPE